LAKAIPGISDPWWRENAQEPSFGERKNVRLSIMQTLFPHLSCGMNVMTLFVSTCGVPIG
jgi:hypothetical protein